MLSFRIAYRRVIFRIEFRNMHMVVTTVLAPKSKVFIKLEEYLDSRKFRRLDTDGTLGIIKARKKLSLFRKPDEIHFHVKAKSPVATDIEISVNKNRPVSTRRDRELEEKIRSRLYFYF